MRQSELFTKTKKESPKDAVTISHKLLVRADFIDQLAAGIYSFLPLGWRVHQKIENIIRQEMNAIGGQEVFLPILQPKTIWEETSRWKTIDPPLFKLKDRHGKELALGSTHEEVITGLVRERVSSYKDLPFSLYQIQDKFRNELRSTGGLLRVREFIMKDLYSFHTSNQNLERYYRKVLGAYKRIFKRCGLTPIAVEASGGTIGGKITHEFMILAESGEDKVVICESCGWGANIELAKNKKTCPKCKKNLKKLASIEAAHTFNLGVPYSEKMGAYFRAKDGREQPIVMGCYGIGLGRVMATIIEVHHDEKGMIWPEGVAPFKVHLISIGKVKKIIKAAEKLYRDLSTFAQGYGGHVRRSPRGEGGQTKNIDVLYDDRDESAGVKFADSDLIGIPWRIVVSERTLAKGSVEIKKRSEKKVRLVKTKNLVKEILSTKS